jgi:hypothetical protein
MKVRKVRCPICKMAVISRTVISHHMIRCALIPDPVTLAEEYAIGGITHIGLADKYGVSEHFIRQAIRLAQNPEENLAIPLYQPSNKDRPNRCRRCQILVDEPGLCRYCVAEAERKVKHEGTSAPVFQRQ